MTGYLYILKNGYLAVDSELIKLKFMVPKILTKINYIVEQSPGYAVIDTNYGEEYIDFESITDELGLEFDWGKIEFVLKGD